MPRSKKVAVGLLTLEEALDILTVDDLKQRVALLPTTERPTRKADLVALLTQHLEGKRLQALWDRLDEPQQKAISEAIHVDDGVFKADKFQAKYGQLPTFGHREERGWGGGRETPSLLRLFFYSEHRYSSGGTVIPLELQERLLQFVSAPQAPFLQGLEEIPEYWEREDKRYDYAENDDGPLLISRSRVYKLHNTPPKITVTVQRIPITRSDTEHAAQQDVQAVLRLIDKGRVAVSDKTLLPSAATISAVVSVLRGGDFYDPKPGRLSGSKSQGLSRALPGRCWCRVVGWLSCTAKSWPSPKPGGRPSGHHRQRRCACSGNAGLVVKYSMNLTALTPLKASKAKASVA